MNQKPADSYIICSTPRTGSTLLCALPDEEMDDIHIEGTFSHFDATALEYDVQFWVEHFAADVYWQERKYALPV